jgi:hypothetical protein
MYITKGVKNRLLNFSLKFDRFGANSFCTIIFLISMYILTLKHVNDFQLDF